MAFQRNVRGGRPSPYPRILFHGLRSAQLLGSIVVMGIMAYFIHYLREGSYYVPWTFIVLLSLSLATIVALAITICLYNFTYLSPRFNLILNGSILLGWALGFGLLSWSISASHLIQQGCSVWKTNAAKDVCRDYKALWSMTLCGTVSTFLALLLDLHTYRKTTRRGTYNLPEDDKDAQHLNNMKSMRVRSAGYEAPQEQGVVAGEHERQTSWQSGEQDIAYHNRYGAGEEETHGPLDSNAYGGGGQQEQRDMGYHNRFFQK